MKKMSLLTLIVLVLAGCSYGLNVQHSEVIDVSKTTGMADGQYRDSRSGTVTHMDFGFFGGGLGKGAASVGTAAAGSGLGGFGASIRPPATQGDPVPFARSIAMINYSRKLSRVKFDYDGIIDFEFSDKPTKAQYQPFGRQSLE